MILFPFGKIYEAAVGVRRRLYEKGIFKSGDLKTAVISVGNLTTGGTGKTPTVAFIAGKLLARGKKVCVLTRGYGRKNPKERVVVADGEKILSDALEGGDEPFELAQKFGGKLAVISDANRFEAGIKARKDWDINVFILDDGFQHLKVKRDLDIVLFDATNPFGNKNLLPAGILREPISVLKRADAAIITRAELVDDAKIVEIKNTLLQAAPALKIFVSKNKIKRFTKLRDFLSKTKSEESQPSSLSYAAFCAIGNAEGFFADLRGKNLKLTLTKSFPDHHFYSQSEITKLEKEAISKGSEVLITTAKDAVKLGHLKFNLPCFTAESEIEFDDEAGFVELISSVVKSPVS